jgi:hypothetical protein
MYMANGLTEMKVLLRNALRVTRENHEKLIIFDVWSAIRTEVPSEYKPQELILHQTFSVGLFLYPPPPQVTM